MAHHKAAIKHERASKERRRRNRAWKTRVRTATRAHKTTPTKETASKLVSTVHRAASRGVVHKRRAAHIQSRADLLRK